MDFSIEYAFQYVVAPARKPHIGSLQAICGCKFNKYFLKSKPTYILFDGIEGRVIFSSIFAVYAKMCIFVPKFGVLEHISWNKSYNSNASRK